MHPESTNKKQSPYQFHRLALAPLLPRAPKHALTNATTKALKLGEKPFTQFLLQQDLAPLWDELLAGYTEQLPFSPETRDALHQARLHATGNYMLQRHSLAKIKTILDDTDIEHVITKGCHTRENYYKIPALRPACDIDILIHPNNKIRCIKAFQVKDFEFYGALENIAQDCSLIKGNTAIDLHWDILRPGRTRQPMVEELLADRVDYGNHWGMNPAATLFLMLVHPVFRKYTTTPHAALVRLIDMALLLDQHPDCTEKTIQLLTAAGLKTAGWITATWLHMLTDSQSAAELSVALQPGRLRRHYLRDWLQSNRSSNLLDKPLWVQLGFTLPAHDRASDAVRAMWRAEQCKRESPIILRGIEEELACSSVIQFTNKDL